MRVSYISCNFSSKSAGGGAPTSFTSAEDVGGVSATGGSFRCSAWVYHDGTPSIGRTPNITLPPNVASSRHIQSSDSQHAGAIERLSACTQYAFCPVKSSVATVRAPPFKYSTAIVELNSKI